MLLRPLLGGRTMLCNRFVTLFFIFHFYVYIILTLTLKTEGRERRRRGGMKLFLPTCFIME